MLGFASPPLCRFSLAFVLDCCMAESICCCCSQRRHAFYHTHTTLQQALATLSHAEALSHSLPEGSVGVYVVLVDIEHRP